MNQFLTPDLKKRFALWVLGIALPEADDLRPHVRSAMLGVAAAAAVGVLIALASAAGLAAAYLYLVERGYSEAISLAAVCASALVLAVIAFAVSKAAVKKSLAAEESLKLFHNPRSAGFENGLNQIVAGFLDGFLEDDEEDAKPAKKTGTKVEAELDVTFQSQEDDKDQPITRH